MKKYLIAVLAITPTAMTLAGCGAGSALSNLTRPKFNDVNLLSGAIPSLAVAGSLATSTPTAAGSINTATEQGIVNNLGLGTLTSLNPAINLTVSGVTSRSAAGTHVGVVLTSNSQPLTTAEFWAAATSGSSRAVVNTIGGSVVVNNNGNFSFGPIDPHDGSTYAGDPMNPSAFANSSLFGVSGFDNSNSGQFAGDFKNMVTDAKANSKPILVYVSAYSDSGASGSVTVNGVKVSGQMDLLN